MGQCKKRPFLLTLCVIQLLFTLERQVFDFLGFMWAPILANFLNILFIIFGFFGTFQYVAKYIFSYAAWNVLWLAWNAFVICYYLNVGVLNRESGWLSLGTGSVSWWEVNGWGCRPHWGEVQAGPFLRPTEVLGCLLPYEQVEALHAALHAFLAFIAVCLALYHAATLSKAQDNRSRGSIKSAGVQSLYSIEFSRPAELRSDPPTKPMTPRRVKRRSVTSRHSTRHSSRRSSQRRGQQSHSNHNTYSSSQAGHSNPTYRASSQQSLSESYQHEELYSQRPPSVRSCYSNYHGARPISLHQDCSSAMFPEPTYSNEGYLSGEATPQVPHKRSVPEPPQPGMSLPYRLHSSQNSFLNNGPPAYHLHQQNQYMTAPDTETAM